MYRDVPYKKNLPKFFILLLLISMAIVSACSVRSDEAEVCAPRRLFMVYMNGSDLESDYGAASNDIAEMCAAQMREGCKVVILTGGAKKWHNAEISSDKNEIFTIENGSVVKQYATEPRDMGIAATLSDFAVRAINENPGYEAHLILWNHGGNAISGFGKDEKHGGDTLILTELSNALKTVHEQTGKKLGTVAFDACLMAGIENVCAISPFCSYIVASEDIMPVEGFDYKSFFSEEGSYFADKSSVAKVLSDTYCASQKGNTSGMVSLSVIDAQKANEIKEAFEAAALLLNDNEIKKPYLLTVFGGTTFDEGYSNTADILSLFEAFELNDTDEFRALADALKSGVIYLSGSSYRASCCGLSVYYPAYITPAATYEAKLYSRIGFSETYADTVKAAAAKGLLSYEKSDVQSISFEVEGVIYDAEAIGEDFMNIYYSALFSNENGKTKTYRIKKGRFSDKTEITAIFVSVETNRGKTSEKYLLK